LIQVLHLRPEVPVLPGQVQQAHTEPQVEQEFREHKHRQELREQQLHRAESF
jgi:hypothetical protein